MIAISVTPRDNGYGYVVEYSDGSMYINGKDVATPTLDELNAPAIPAQGMVF